MIDEDNPKPGAPIVPVQFTHGPNVVEIGDMRVARGMTRRPFSSCKHAKLTYDRTERRIRCDDCETEIEAFDAFISLVERWDFYQRKIDEYRSVHDHTLLSRAAKAFDVQFRKHSTVPCCPHCNKAIFPEDVDAGLSCMSKSLAMRQRGMNPRKE